MKKSGYIVFCFLFLFFSCTKKETCRVTDFESVERITVYDSIFSDVEEPLGPVTGLVAYGNVLVMGHMNDEYRFSFVDVESGEKICRWGLRGEGPNEYIDFGSNFCVRDSFLIFQTVAKKEINYVSLNDILSHDTSVDVEKETYPYTVDFRPRKIYPLGDKKIATGSFRDSFIGFLDKDNAIISNDVDFPFPCEEVEGIFRGNLFQSQVVSNERHNRFAISIFSSDIFEIYELDGSEVNRVYVSPFESVPQIYKRGDRYAVDSDRSIAGFMSMAASSELIFCTFSSQSYSEAASQGFVSDEVLCFDWDGNKIKKYILPFPVSCICVGDGFLYGIRQIGDVMNVCRFKI